MDEVTETMLKLINMIMAEQSKTDSIEIGSPSKGGVVKVYFNADKPDEAAERIRRAMTLRGLANDEMINGTGAASKAAGGC